MKFENSYKDLRITVESNLSSLLLFEYIKGFSVYEDSVNSSLLVIKTLNPIKTKFFKISEDVESHENT